MHRIDYQAVFTIECTECLNFSIISISEAADDAAEALTGAFRPAPCRHSTQTAGLCAADPAQKRRGPPSRVAPHPPGHRTCDLRTEVRTKGHQSKVMLEQGRILKAIRQR